MYKGASSHLVGIRLARLRQVKSHRRSFRARRKSATLLHSSDKQAEICVHARRAIYGGKAVKSYYKVYYEK